VKRALAGVFLAGVLVGAAAVWAWQLLGPRPIPIEWEGVP
jgi:hypothetical protein